jgi:hypothetical protein
VAVGTPVNRIVELAGPEPLPLDELVRRFLSATDDSRPVIADTRAWYFGPELNDYSLAGERVHYRDRWRISRNIGVQRRSSVLWRDIHGGGVVPCERRGMEEVKIVPESISGIQYYQIIRSQIEHEDNLINQRLSWFVAAQAFLFSAYAILLNAPSQVRLQSFATQQEILFFLIPLVAIGVSILIYITVIAAMLATANLRRLLKTHMNEKDSALLPPVQGYRQTLLLGQASPILIPLLFMISWIVLLIKSL